MLSLEKAGKDDITMKKDIKNWIILLVIIIPILFLALMVLDCESCAINNENFLEVNANINPHFKQVFSGEEVLVETQIQFVRNNEPKDIYIVYSIQGETEEVLTLKSETIKIQTRASTVNNLYIPLDTKPGQYTLYIDIKYNGFEARASDSFEIVDELPTEKVPFYKKIPSVLMAAIIIFLLYILILIIIKFRLHKFRKN